MAGHSRGGTTVTYNSHITGGGGVTGGGGHSREAAITTTPINDTNALRAQQNLQQQAALSAVANQMAQSAQRAAAQAQNVYESPMVNQAARVSSAGTRSASAVPTAQADPYADLMAIYQQKLDAENAANEQRRQAQLNALNSRYATAKSRLSDAFNSGESALNNDANRALREAFVQSKLNERSLNQQLQSMGINGGALESSLARAYNDYGNSRNAIEQNRMDALKDLLSQYQGQLGDMESAYAANLADLDSNYFGNGLDFVTDYYDAIAALQKQNAASNLQAQLGKRSAGNVSANENNGLNKDIVNGLKNYKGNLAAARAYLTYMGVPEQTQNDYLMNGGFGADLMDDGSLASLGIAPTRSASNVTPAVRSTIINNLKRIYPTTAQDGLSANESLYRNVINQLNQYAQQYGLSDAEAQAILAEAGF